MDSIYEVFALKYSLPINNKSRTWMINGKKVWEASWMPIIQPGSFLI
jgi:hypothetical protein